MKIAVCISGLIGYTKKRGEGDLIDFYKTKNILIKIYFLTMMLIILYIVGIQIYRMKLKIYIILKNIFLRIR